MIIIMIIISHEAKIHLSLIKKNDQPRAEPNERLRIALSTTTVDARPAWSSRPVPPTPDSRSRQQSPTIAKLLEPLSLPKTVKAL
jgi:hypothetical protein